MNFWNYILIWAILTLQNNLTSGRIKVYVGFMRISLWKQSYSFIRYQCMEQWWLLLERRLNVGYSRGLSKGELPWKSRKSSGWAFPWKNCLRPSVLGEVFSSLVPLRWKSSESVFWKGDAHSLHYQKEKREADVIEKNEKVSTITWHKRHATCHLQSAIKLCTIWSGKVTVQPLGWMVTNKMF